jgi:hypothetical protein
MNAVKLLASRNILIGVGVIAALFAVFVVLQTRTGSSETVPPAERFSAPPQAEGDVVPLDTVLTAFQRSGAQAVRRYRHAPLSAHVDAVTPVGKNGWASEVTLDGGRASAYFSDQQWKSIEPPIAAGETRTITCADWQYGAASAVAMYGCGVAQAH